MEVDVSSTVAAETIEGLKREPAADAPTVDAPPDEDDAPTKDPEAARGDEGRGRPSLGVDAQEFDSAVGKLWVVIWAIIARLLEDPDLKEEKEMAEEAADALGPVARKHIPRQMQDRGPEAVAVAWISGRIYSKSEHLL